MITFNLVELSKPRTIVQTESLLCEIDNALYSLGKKRRDQIRFGFKSIDDEAYYDFIQLTLMRKMLISKTCCDDCLDCIKLEELISLVQALLYKFC